MSNEYKMPNYDKEIQREAEIDAWIAFKKAVEECLRWQFSEKQLMAHIQVKYCNVKGVIEREGIHG